MEMGKQHIFNLPEDVSPDKKKCCPKGSLTFSYLCFLLFMTLPTFWAEQILILRFSFFGFFGSPERLTTLPQAPVFFQKNDPHIYGSPELVGTLPQAPFFFQKDGPQIYGSPELVGTLPHALFFSSEN